MMYAFHFYWEGVKKYLLSTCLMNSFSSSFPQPSTSEWSLPCSFLILNIYCLPITAPHCPGNLETLFFSSTALLAFWWLVLLSCLSLPSASTNTEQGSILNACQASEWMRGWMKAYKAAYASDVRWLGRHWWPVWHQCARCPLCAGRTSPLVVHLPPSQKVFFVPWACPWWLWVLLHVQGFAKHKMNAPSDGTLISLCSNCLLPQNSNCLFFFLRYNNPHNRLFPVL